MKSPKGHMSKPLSKRIKKLQDLFPSQKAYHAFLLFAAQLRESSNRITVHHTSQFATMQASEKVYNKANFYWYVITPLVDLGFLDKIPSWNSDLKKTQYCYVPLKFQLPRHPVGHGYYRDSWYICKEWNDLFFGPESELFQIQNRRSVQTISDSISS
jgi:hypothetical protein